VYLVTKPVFLAKFMSLKHACVDGLAFGNDMMCVSGPIMETHIQKYSVNEMGWQFS
jgi:hypothetical protein